jgi:hypothetical protein
VVCLLFGCSDRDVRTRSTGFIHVGTCSAAFFLQPIQNRGLYRTEERLYKEPCIDDVKKQRNAEYAKHINDPVLSSLKMEGVRLLLYILYLPIDFCNKYYYYLNVAYPSYIYILNIHHIYIYCIL